MSKALIIIITQVSSHQLILPYCIYRWIIKKLIFKKLDQFGQIIECLFTI